MTRKTISTSHAVVICAVCGRTLLRGENAEVFIAGGQRRTVCELCTGRAVHEGWLREGFDDVGVRRNGRSRSRSMLGRLRQRREEYLAGEGEEEGAAEAASERGGHEGYVPLPEARDVHAVPTNAELKLARAIEVFNVSDQVRTIAGVARSLGAPTVAVRPSPTEGAVVSIVAAWEITWYRFEVDLGNEAAGVRKTDQGAELSELEPEDLANNAAAAADGTLSLVS
jgi:hypothetical protein